MTTDMRAWIIGLLALAVGCDGGGDTGGKDTGDTAAAVDADQDGYDADIDCDDADDTVHPGADEVWYDGVDQDCGGDDDYDQDGDGIRGGDGEPDCVDTDPTVFPGADETCNGVDDDCDLETDEDATDAFAVYADLDGDGYGTGDAQGVYCEAPLGTSPVDGDCDDNLPERSPGTPETCDGLDNDCDGYADDTPTDGGTWYPDRDGDGFGDTLAPAVACAQPEGYLLDGTDCDDADEQSYPGATELCDLKDNDCDGGSDEDATDPRTYYQDGDGDGYGLADVTAASCGAPAGYAEDAGDCDDADATRSPGIEEVCDDVDNDCDGTVDSDAASATVYYPDEDGDGYGDDALAQPSCDAVADWIVTGGDCDDADAGEHPGADESCDGDDDDCDGAADEADAVDAAAWYLDADADGYGDETVMASACAQPSGYSANAEDCDDASAASNPGARERCDGGDNDCDGSTDEEDAYDAPSWYADGDADGYGDAAVSAAGCSAPTGHVANDDDCDDADAAINPAAAETRDLVDEDCDAYVDEDFVAVGDIVITEVARQPYSGGTGRSTNADAQWFELYNASAYDVDLSNWYLEEQVGDHFTVSPDAALVVPAGGYVVLCYADTWFADPADCDYTWGDGAWGSSTRGDPYYDTTYYFDRDDDLVALYLEGALMDQVDWELGADASGDQWPRTAKYSMELDDNALDPSSNDDAGAWCLASSSDIYSLSGSTGHPDYGTPGEANGSCD